jgi:hypothetical protein
MGDWRDEHPAWLVARYKGIPARAEAAKADKDLSDAWIKGRGIIEDFHILVENIANYPQDLAEITDTKHKLGSKVRKYLERQRKAIARARALEQHIRDSLHINIGNISLEESRRSIKQADGVERLTSLAFIFLPIFLVTSFFGMNIQEITGSGASWKAVLISAFVFGGLLLLVCGIVWRKSHKVRFTAGILVLPVIILLVLFQACVFNITWLLYSSAIIAAPTDRWSRTEQCESFRVKLGGRLGVVPTVKFYMTWWSYRHSFTEGDKADIPIPYTYIYRSRLFDWGF